MSLYRRLTTFADQVLPFVATVAMLAALWCVFVYAPNERVMGAVQRIFYFHVGSASAAYLGVFVAAGASALFLWRGHSEYDRLAVAAVEIGMMFCTVVLVTGPIWARPIWGVWWAWDPRLTMTVILWTIYAVYLVLRTGTREDPQIARYAAVLAIIGSLDVPLIHISVNLWRGIHPSVISAPPDKGGLEDPRMVVALLVTLVAFALLFLWLLWLRYEGLRLRDALQRVEDRMGENAR
jgi:heme exporter protein C